MVPYQGRYFWWYILIELDELIQKFKVKKVISRSKHNKKYKKKLNTKK
jgi:hypothetical protein